MAEETQYSSELSPLSHSTTATPQTLGLSEGSDEITGKQLIRTSQISRVQLDNNLVGCDQADVLDSNPEVSGIVLPKKSDSFVGPDEIIMNVAEIEPLGSDEISNKIVNSNGFGGICMNVQENYVAICEDADEIAKKVVDTIDTGRVSGPEFEGSEDPNVNVFRIGQLGSDVIPKKMVNMDETGQVTEPKLVNEELEFEKNEDISEFLQLKDEVGKIGRENSSEIGRAGSCNSQYGANSEVASFISKFDKPVLVKTAVPATVMNMKMIDDTVVLEISDMEREINGKGGNKDSCNGVVKSEKIRYSRKELEKLRFLGGKEGQKKVWRDVYNGFSEDMKTEYDALGSSKQKKHGGAASDHHHQGKRSNHDRGSLGYLSSRNVSYDAELSCSTHSSSFDGDSNTKCDDDLEEWIEDDVSDDEYQSIRRPAFFVEGEPDFESGPPEDGLEYLRRVRWEAAQIPKVKVAKLDKRKLKEQSVYMPKIPDIEKCPPHLAPLREWEDEFIVDFLNLRLALYLLVDNSDAASAESETMIFCRPESKKRTSKCLASLELPTGVPTLSTLLAMDPATRVTLLNKRITLFESATSLSKDDCEWLFSLCAVVGTPLDADTSAALRCLLRRCAKLRAEKSEVDEEVIMLNILVTIAGKCFGQGEH